ncbi:hypothetical protein ACKKBG_A14705 [Auxenochlorella protothecoides x Auxenochlorella symbiontica]
MARRLSVSGRLSALAVQCTNLELALQQEDVTHCSSGIALAQCLTQCWCCCCDHSTASWCAPRTKECWLRQCLCRPPAVGACCAWAYCHGDECAARLRVAEGLICQRGIGQRSAVCWADTRSPPLRQAPHAMARMLLGESLAVVDAAQDGPAALALGVSAPWRIMLRSAICPSYIL